MRKVNHTKCLFILLIFGLTSCFSNKDEVIGKKEVKGSADLFIKIYQTDEADFVTPISVELENNQSLEVMAKKFVVGTDDKIENLDNFHPFLVDSIFYLCYPYPQVYTIHHLDKSKSNLSRDALFKKIKEHDKKLVDNEK